MLNRFKQVDAVASRSFSQSPEDVSFNNDSSDGYTKKKDPRKVQTFSSFYHLERSTRNFSNFRFIDWNAQ